MIEPYYILLSTGQLRRIGTEAAGKPNKREQGAKRTTKPMTSKQVVLGQKKRDYVNNPGSHIERRFLADIEAAGLPLPVTEYEFCPGRKWRIDAAYPEQKIAIELEGGMWQHGQGGADLQTACQFGLEDDPNNPVRLSVAFVEWLMGFPAGWLNLEHSETP